MSEQHLGEVFVGGAWWEVFLTVEDRTIVYVRVARDCAGSQWQPGQPVVDSVMRAGLTATRQWLTRKSSTARLAKQIPITFSKVRTREVTGWLITPSRNNRITQKEIVAAAGMANCAVAAQYDGRRREMTLYSTNPSPAFDEIMEKMGAVKRTIKVRTSI